MADPKDVTQRDANSKRFMSSSGLNTRSRETFIAGETTCNSVTAIKRAANSRSEAPSLRALKGHARAELHFIFVALAVESHFMPAFSQAD